MCVLDTLLSLPPQKRKRFASVTCLLPIKNKSKHHIGAINQIFHAATNFKFFSLKAFKKNQIKKEKRDKKNKSPLD